MFNYETKENMKKAGLVEEANSDFQSGPQYLSTFDHDFFVIYMYTHTSIAVTSTNVMEFYLSGF